jgi:hypothetical protein
MKEIKHEANIKVLQYEQNTEKMVEKEEEEQFLYIRIPIQQMRLQFQQ